MVVKFIFSIFARMYPKLNLPVAELKIENGFVWDILRKKRLKLTPEEWVRQHFIHFLIQDRNYPEGLLVSEYKVDYAGRAVRADLVAFNNEQKPLLIVECKAPKVKITEDTFYQAAKYSNILSPSYIVLTNGLNHVCAALKENGEIEYLENVPDYCDI